MEEIILGVNRETAAAAGGDCAAVVSGSERSPVMGLTTIRVYHYGVAIKDYIMSWILLVHNLW